MVIKKSNIRRGLSLGRSEPWPTVLAQITEGRYSQLDAGPILRYFKPLHEWLQLNNEGQPLGWNPSEALVAGRTSSYSSQAATAAYVIVALLLVTLLLLAACVLARRWRKTKDGNSSEPTSPDNRAS
ncbi:Peptidase M2 peptidyl-dipeptidase A [Trinorchestia longiramus]|nr:Peptidase M2 peptidyl-dipeptidase A [Trinorchestia longiramus]